MENVDKYFVPVEYEINSNPQHHNDTIYTDQAQREVYEYADQCMKNNEFKTVIDVGCGSGYKLVNILGGYNTIGIETEPCLSFLKSKYPYKKWYESGEKEKNFREIEDLAKADIVICSDVIEHIVDPDILIEYLLKLNPSYYIISTPCRKILCEHDKFKRLYAKTWNGPPHNKCHVREWTMEEFKKYLGKYFTIISSHYGINQIECQYHLLVKK